MPSTAGPSAAVPSADSFPRRYARTQRFTLGQPRGFSVSRDGRTVLFLRSKAGDDPVTCLWRLDVATGTEALLADPRALPSDTVDEELPPEEAARRERLREGAGGIVAYGSDDDLRLVAFALGGRLWLTDVADGRTRQVDGTSGVIDPRPSPDGRHVAFVSDGALHVHDVAAGGVRRLAGPTEDEPDVTWALAEFVAAEEMGRFRGYWWSPASDALLVARVDESPVQVWHLSDPANPEREPRTTRYPAAGTVDADVTLWVVHLDGTRDEVVWDHDAFPYLTTVDWTPRGPALLGVTDRPQSTTAVLAVDTSGAVAPVRELHDPVWLDQVAGVPTWLRDGALLTVEVSEDTYRLCVNGRPVTPPGLQVRAVSDVNDDGVLVAVVPADDPTVRQVVHWTPDGGLGPSTRTPGVRGTTSAGGTLVQVWSTWDAGPQAGVWRDGGQVATIASHALGPGVTPRARMLRTRARDIVTAVFLPTGHVPGSARLPVLMSPYGGPHAQRVLAARNAHLESQWLADQGFAVVVADGRGTPRTPSWERAVRLDLAGPVLADQVEALHAAAAAFPDLDLGRVGIRGWSFGGYLAVLAVLRRPDVFHAAVAGAPVTDWRLYDTFYTERYLGHPDAFPEAYERSSLLTDAARPVDADHPWRPMMLVHGLADDNVVAAHTLRLSSALLAAGRPHTVLPLSGVTHMTPQEVVAENLLLLQLDFLRSALAPRP